MGYYTSISGSATITPPIDMAQWPVKKQAVDAEEPQFGYFAFTDVPGDEDVKIVDGVLTVVGTSSGHTEVIVYWEDSIKAYDFTADCNNLLTWVQKNGSTITGTFRGEGEETGDIWRVRFEGTDWIHEAPKLMWPNGDVES